MEILKPNTTSPTYVSAVPGAFFAIVQVLAVPITLGGGGAQGSGVENVRVDDCACLVDDTAASLGIEEESFDSSLVSDGCG